MLQGCAECLFLIAVVQWAVVGGAGGDHLPSRCDVWGSACQAEQCRSEACLKLPHHASRDKGSILAAVLQGVISEKVCGGRAAA